MKIGAFGFAIIFSAGLSMSAVQLTPTDNTGTIEGRVTHPNSSEGIPDVQITLIGPTPVIAYVPNPALTPQMRQQIERMIESAPPIASPEEVSYAASRMQSQLLGLPAPVEPTFNTLAQTSAQTDGGGRFRFKNLAPGRYQVRAQRDGYFGAPNRGLVEIESPTMMSRNAVVTDGKPTPEVTFTMLRGGLVSGRVRDPGGLPVFGAQITAYKIVYRDERQLLESVNSKTTDDRGEYRLFWLPPGEYYIGATPRPPGTAVGRQDMQSRTFFPSSVDGSDAKKVTVTDGTELTSVDIGLRVGTVRITGRVINPFKGADGQPTSLSEIYLLPSGADALTDRTSAVVQNSAANPGAGNFEIRGVLPGIYNLFIGTQSALGRTAWGHTELNVGSGDVQGVSLTILPGIEVKVRLTVDGVLPEFTMAPPSSGGLICGPIPPGPRPRSTTTVPRPTIRLTLGRPSEKYGWPFTDPFICAANQLTSYDPAGTYVFPNVPEGRYFLQAEPLPLNAYVADVKVGGISVADGIFEVGRFTDIVEVKVKTNGAKIQGAVIDSERKPFASAFIWMEPQKGLRFSHEPKYALSDAAGNFTINAVAPGEYKLFAFESLMASALGDPKFVEKYGDKGQNVTVDSAGPYKLELNLIPK